MNRTAWPARMGQALKIRYFVDLSEVFAAGYKLEDLTLTMGYNQDNAAKPPVLMGSPVKNLYFVEIDFTGAAIYPGGQSQHSKEVQFRLALPHDAKADAWNPLNDPSYSGLQPGGDPMVTGKIPVMEKGVWVSGTSPEGTPVLHRAKPRDRSISWNANRMELAFAWPRGETFRVEVRTPAGRLLARSQGRALDGRTNISLRALPAGLALVSISGDGSSWFRCAISVLP